LIIQYNTCHASSRATQKTGSICSAPGPPRQLDFGDCALEQELKDPFIQLIPSWLDTCPTQVV
jgi:hypothetical protein